MSLDNLVEKYEKRVRWLRYKQIAMMLLAFAVPLPLIVFGELLAAEIMAIGYPWQHAYYLGAVFGLWAGIFLSQGLEVLITLLEERGLTLKSLGEK